MRQLKYNYSTLTKNMSVKLPNTGRAGVSGVNGTPCGPNGDGSIKICSKKTVSICIK